ncbi:N-acetylglucosamine-6-phosphate deacetylase [Shimia biformata]|uniref:N-acetylglucosamine-6-phosphate deacetylase n=1 Tax=Shimia biformata TaxID=1294299 RepID=UPI00194E9E10|nr:N-acetylglucosamine-6-phosphate deacetylase [Shimia biformata]
MSMADITYTNARLFDGAVLHPAGTVTFRGGRLADGESETVVDLGGDILSPGYVDLQVNGGGGVMFNAAPTVETLRLMATAHNGLGVTALLPTLITDTPEVTAAAIAAAVQAVGEGVPGIAGLHLEGPHLSIARKGAHSPALIRPMEVADLEALLAAAEVLPVLKITIAPENVTTDQVRALAEAGVLVAIGHSDADFATVLRYVDAGARCVTHLFNAMSQLGNREPGIVGAALDEGRLSAGLIADAIHVHPASMRRAWAAKRGPGQIYLVSDAMSVAGTDQPAFTLNGREITRKDGRLTLADGTLAGADLDLTRALNVLVGQCGIDLGAALKAATTVPAELIGLYADADPLAQANMIRISGDLTQVSPLQPFA